MNLILTAINKKYYSLFFILFFISITFIFTQKVFAVDNFDTSYNVIYDVKEDETTNVTFNIGLTNKSSDFFATSYNVQTGFNDIENLKVQDSLGPINFKAEKNDNGVMLIFDFNEKTVGKGNTQKFSISFDTKEITKNFGNIREINIPALANQRDFSSLKVQVKTPRSFGKPSIVKPYVKSVEITPEEISFTKNDLKSSGISIAFGDKQIYDFNLKYHITNKNVFPEISEIALPSDNNYQKIIIDNITPKPENVLIDENGNWIAQFKLLPSQDLAITVKGSAKVSHMPTNTKLTDEKKKLFLRSDKFWEVQDSKIQNKAKELKTSEAIYDYVKNTLKYDTRRIINSQERLGAKNSLNNPDSAISLEFTDLFIALSRAAGIPAMAVEGFANTSNITYKPLTSTNDVLHTWPQFYDEDKKTWIMVDPTWENITKGIDYFNVFDFDHFAFVLKGIDSEYPISAGGYKSKVLKEQKDVHITTSTEFNQDNPILNFTTDFSKNLFGGLPISGKIIVSNDSNTLTPAQIVKIESKELSPKSQDLHVKEIPPYGKQVLTINFAPVHPLTNKTFVAKISIGQEALEKDIIVLPIYRSIYFSYFLGGLLAGILLLIISFIIYRTRRLHFPR